MLTGLILLPALIALAIALAPAKGARPLAILGAALTAGLSLATLLPGDAPAAGFRLETSVWWLQDLGIRYHVGVDGVSSLLAVMTALLGLLAVSVPFKIADGRERTYYAALLATVSATIGAFCALDLILFYVFFEASLVPVFFLIGVFGGPSKARAATKFFLFTVAGSLLMLAALFTLRQWSTSFDYADLKLAVSHGDIPAATLTLIFLGFVAAFAVKTPLFPFHTWLPDAYAACPAAGVALLSGAMAKMGAYGFLRFGSQLMPAQAESLAPTLVLLATIGIVYAALVAAVQRDVKRVVAYSSVSHLGYVVLGLFSGHASGTAGAVLQMVNHGITTGALFLIVGVLEERRGTLSLKGLGGVWAEMPVFSRIFLIVTLSSIALPLTNGFVGEFLILVGAYQNYPALAAIATTGAIWSAVYMLWMFQRVAYGPAKAEGLRDIGLTEKAVFGAVVVLIFFLGVVPAPFLKMIQGSLGTAGVSVSLAVGERIR